MKELNLIVQDIRNTKSFVLNLKSKFTMIMGQSASGKSTLISTIREWPNWHNRYNNVLIFDDSSPIDIMQAAASLDDSYVLLIDEDGIKTLRRRNKCKKLNKLRCHVVIACRDPLYDLMYSHIDVYKLECFDNSYKLVRAFPDYMTWIDDTAYFTEDSGSGFQYYNSHFSNVKPAVDNTTFTDCIGTGTVIADGALMGPQVTDWYNRRLNYKLFLPLSFEWLVLRKLNSEYNTNWYNLYNTQFSSIERFFTNELYKLRPDYDKSKCPDDILEMDLLSDFMEDGGGSDIWRLYCTKYNIQNEEAERARLTTVYGTSDFEDMLKQDFL